MTRRIESGAVVKKVNADAVLPFAAEVARARLDRALDAATKPSTTIRVGPRRYFHPRFDTGVVVTDIDDTSCLLTVRSSYRPPLGRFGALVDRTLMHGVAASTAQEFTHRLAYALTHNTTLTDQKRGLP